MNKILTLCIAFCGSVLVACAPSAEPLNAKDQAVLDLVKSHLSESQEVEEFSVDWGTRIHVANTDWMDLDLRSVIDSVGDFLLENESIINVIDKTNNGLNPKANAFGHVVSYRTKDMPFCSNLVAVFLPDSTQLTIYPVDYTDEDHSIYYAGKDKSLYKTLIRNLNKSLTK